jgi:hypothetical protein
MKNKKNYIFILIFLTSFLFLESTKPSKGIEFSCSKFNFFVNEPSLIDYPEMTFTVKNNQDDSVIISCDYSSVEGINLTVYFEWQEITLDVGEQVLNHYSIEINSTLSVTIPVRMNIRHRPVGSNTSQSTGGGIITNYITFYTDDDGALLDLNIVDQANTPRNASVILYYRENITVCWTPIKQFNDTRLSGVFPLGKYFVQAYDTKTGIYGEKFFDLTENSIVSVSLKLVGFSKFKLIYFDSGNKDLPNTKTVGVECSIYNYIEVINSVEIYISLYEDGNHILDSPIDKRSEFVYTTSYETSLYLQPYDYQNAKYTVHGYILAGGVLIAERSEGFSYTRGSNNEDIVSQVSGIIPYMVVIGIFGYVFYQNRRSNVETE